MKTRRIIFILVSLSILFFSFGCGKGDDELASNAMEDIESISYSVLGRLDPITVIFNKDIKADENIEKACSVSPDVKGEWRQKNNRSIEFTPAEPYDFKQELSLKLDVGLLLENTADTKTLTKTFTIAEPEFKILSGNLLPDSNNSSIFNFEAKVESDIPMELSLVEKIISATLKDKNKKTELKVKLSNATSSSQYKVKIKGIKRNDNFQELLLKWNLSALGVEKKSYESFTVAPESVFEVTGIQQTSDTEICVNFSDKISASQDLRGLISVSSNQDFNYRWNVDNFKLKLYVQNRIWPDDTKVTIRKGIKSHKGKVLQKSANFAVTVAWEKPNIAFTKQGNIVPAQKDTSVLVSTKNIKGLLLEAFQIYQNNILQHFQINTMARTRDLERVGEPVFRQRFNFDWNNSMKNRWETRKLDITKLLEKFPGGMFELRVSFLKEDSLYANPRQNADFSHLPFPRDMSKLELSKNLESDYWENADISSEERHQFWRMRENPMHPAYYIPSYSEYCHDSKMILVSNIGLSVKRDRDNKLYIATADLNTAKPMSGVKIKLFSYAQKELASAETDSDGLLVLANEKDAYFVQAESDGWYNWVMLDSHSLSTSHFAVDGVRTKKGVKGYLYGERGVWRPGDDIHLTFILQDSENNLPKDIPVNFSLSDPMGKKTDIKVATSSVDGFYRFDTKTNADDKTGNWTARVTVGGKTWAKNIKVENIVPNRLFVNLKSPNKYLSSGGNELELSGEWLHGAKASNLKAEISARYILNRSPFEKYKNYNFINPEIHLASAFKKVWTGKLNEGGSANINLALSSGKKSPGKLTAIFETRIYEPSGMFSVENKSFDYSPYTQYVGMEIPKSDDEYRDMLYTDRKHKLNFLVLDPDGSPKQGNSNIVVKLYKLRWYWWWDVDDQKTNYTTARDTKLIKTWSLTAKQGKANLNLELDDSDWGRYLISVEDKTSGHSSAQLIYFDWESWASRKTSDDDSSSMLMLTTDKTKYYSNDEAVINFPSYKGAEALITTEKNGKVLKQEWMTCDSTLSSYKLKLSDNMAPNIYVHVSLIQKHNQTKNSLPIRMYGITPVMIENKNSRLLPEIKAAKVFEPNSKAEFTVSEKNGKAMTCTIAVVDEGLLGLTAFNTGNPWNAFYKKESSQLKSWDIYSYVIDAYSGEIASILTVGGGGYIDRKGGKNAERFKPVVFYFGPYEIKANENKKIEFDMPQYSGAVRIMAVAGKDGAYGIAEKQVKVKSDLIVMPTLPRTLGIGEDVEIPVTAFNGTSKERTASVKLNATGAVKFSDSKKLTIPANGDKTVFFKVKSEKGGVAEFKAELSARGVVKKAISNTEIAVLSRGTPFTDVDSFSLAPNASQIKNIKLKGEVGTRAISVEVSQMPALGLEQRLSYLLNYPYGCIEQISSKAFAQLYLPQILELDKTEVETVKENVNSVLERYQNYQVSSGAFAYWPSSSIGNEWGTNYAGHFMTEAKKQGYGVNESVYQAWLKHQKESARNWSSVYTYSIESQAYRLFTLANAGQPEIGAMNRLKNMDKNLNSLSRSLLASSYALAGYNKVAKKLISKIVLPTKAYRYTGHNFSSNIRDTAVILSAYTAVNEKTKTPGLIKKLAKISSSNEWLSTQETAWILSALAPYYKFDKSKVIKYEIQSDGNTISDTLASSSRIYKMQIKNKLYKKLQIKNTGKTPLFVSITSSGRLKPGEEDASSSNLSLKVTCFDEDGKPIQPSQLKKLGQRFKIRVSIKNETKYYVDNVVLSLPIPTGWEMTNLRMSQQGKNDNTNKTSVYNYQDIKDTHIYTHFDLSGHKTKTIEFSGTVTHKGEYYIPPITAEAMYDNAFYALTKY